MLELFWLCGIMSLMPEEDDIKTNNKLLEAEKISSYL